MKNSYIIWPILVEKPENNNVNEEKRSKYIPLFFNKNEDQI